MLTNWRRQLDYLLRGRYYGHGGLTQAAAELGVRRMALWEWRAGVREPNWANRRRINEVYREQKAEESDNYVFEYGLSA